jgi:hypothetical protein
MPNTILDLGRKVKAKYPGQYDDISDAEVGRRVKAKFPGQYDDFQDVAPASQPQPSVMDKVTSYLPSVKTAAPIVGGIVGGAVGPEGIPVGAAVGSAAYGLYQKLSGDSDAPQSAMETVRRPLADAAGAATGVMTGMGLAKMYPALESAASGVWGRVMGDKTPLNVAKVKAADELTAAGKALEEELAQHSQSAIKIDNLQDLRPNVRVAMLRPENLDPEAESVTVSPRQAHSISSRLGRMTDWSTPATPDDQIQKNVYGAVRTNMRELTDTNALDARYHDALVAKRAVDTREKQLLQQAIELKSGSPVGTLAKIGLGAAGFGLGQKILGYLGY